MSGVLRLWSTISVVCERGYYGEKGACVQASFDNKAAGQRWLEDRMEGWEREGW